MKINEKMVNCLTKYGYTYNPQNEQYVKDIYSNVDKTHKLGSIYFECYNGEIVKCAFWKQESHSLVIPTMREILRQMDYMEEELDHIFLGRE